MGLNEFNKYTLYMYACKSASLPYTITCSSHKVSHWSKMNIVYIIV